MNVFCLDPSAYCSWRRRNSHRSYLLLAEIRAQLPNTFQYLRYSERGHCVPPNSIPICILVLVLSACKMCKLPKRTADEHNETTEQI